MATAVAPTGNSAPPATRLARESHWAGARARVDESAPARPDAAGAGGPESPAGAASPAVLTPEELGAGALPVALPVAPRAAGGGGGVAVVPLALRVSR